MKLEIWQSRWLQVPAKPLEGQELLVAKARFELTSFRLGTDGVLYSDLAHRTILENANLTSEISQIVAELPQFAFALTL